MPFKHSLRTAPPPNLETAGGGRIDKFAAYHMQNHPARPPRIIL